PVFPQAKPPIIHGFPAPALPASRSPPSRLHSALTIRALAHNIIMISRPSLVFSPLFVSG
ncbi:hypothetical protein FIBSPDRAFT_879306, partial [Athelia psychrophila]